MGSQSDYKTMQLTEKTLKQLGVSFETKIVSAHRTPKRMYNFALKAEKKAVNQIYNISNGKPELLWPILDNLFLELKLAPPSKKISLSLVLVLAKLMELHAKFLNGYKEPALTIYGVGTLTMSFGMDISKAKKLLGYEPKQSVQEALDEFVEWYKSEEL